MPRKAAKVASTAPTTRKPRAPRAITTEQPTDLAPALISTWKMQGTANREHQNGPVYFYDGELNVVDGQVEVPTNRPEWAGRLRRLGFAFTDSKDEADWVATNG